MYVHVVTTANKHLYEAELERFFRLRHDIYVDEMGWREASNDGYERDQFDTDDAFYFLGFLNNQLIAGSRLIATDKPHLLGEVFPHICNTTGVWRNSRIAEWTRGFIIPEYRDQGGMRIKAYACSAIMEYCLNERITHVGGIQEVYWLPLWRRLGWHAHHLGDPIDIDGTWCVAAYCDVNADALARVNARLKLNQSVLVHQGPYKPFIDQTTSNAAPSNLKQENEIPHA